MRDPGRRRATAPSIAACRSGACGSRSRAASAAGSPVCHRTDTRAASRDNIPLALIGWVSGCTVIWSSLFTVGNFLYGRTGTAWFLLAVFVVAGLVLIRVINRLWAVQPEV